MPDITCREYRTEHAASFSRLHDSICTAFAGAYAAYGGYPRRHPGYYTSALQTNEFGEAPMVFTAFWHRTPGDGRLMAYAPVGEEQHTPAVQLLAIAAVGDDPVAALSLFGAFCPQAAERDLAAVASLPDPSPYVPALRALGM